MSSPYSMSSGPVPRPARKNRCFTRASSSRGWNGVKQKTGLPAAARAERYRLLARAARASGATHILTAHTRDDQAETLLMRMLRGSGIAGLAAMARETERDGVWLARPLLDIPKSRLVATARPHDAVRSGAV